MMWVGLLRGGYSEKTVDTLRLLTQPHNDISRWDMTMFWSLYDRPAEGAEYMCLQGLIESEFDISNDQDFFLVLATALRRSCAEPLQWETFLRFLVRKKKCLPSLCYPYKGLKYGTPFDELF